MVTTVMNRGQNRRWGLKTVIGRIDLVITVIERGGSVVAGMRLVVDISRSRRAGAVRGGRVGRRRGNWVAHDV